MVELSVEIEQGSTQCLTYKHRESRLQGRMVVKAADKLKLRQLSIRLISTELVDFHSASSSKTTTRSNNNGGSSGLHSYLQKSSRAIGTWVILERKPSASHVLLAGEHHYSFEIPLPKGLDGSIASKTYTLHYELEGRLEHSFKLKPNTICLQPIELVQVPMALNLHADDRISLSVVPRLHSGGREAALMAEDIPIGKAVCVVPDAVDQKESFVLHHLWDGVLSFRLRLPYGRVLPADANPVLDIEAVPIARHHRFIRANIILEEISIIARPQHAGSARARSKTQLVTDAEGAGSSSNVTLQLPHQEPTAGRRASISASQLSSSSEDSLAANPSHNAWAYAQECSAEYRNAITRVREMGRVSVAWTPSQYASLAAYHGILAAKPNLRIPPAAEDAAHPDLRNSHIQVHHQLVYQLEYQVLSPEMISAVPQKEPRIRAAAHILGSLGRANIVRREELHNGSYLSAPAGQTHLVRGTLPVALVPAKIANLWAIRGLENDPIEVPSPVVAVIRSHENESIDYSDDTALRSAATRPGASSSSHTADARGFGEEIVEPASPVLEAGRTQSTAGTSRSSSPTPQGPAIQYPQPTTYRESDMDGTDHGEPHAVDDSVEPASVMPTPAPAQPPQSSGTSSTNAAFDPLIFQQQIEQFQAQQRQQQQQFFRQLAEQYALLVAGGHALPTSPLPQELEEHLPAMLLSSNQMTAQSSTSAPGSLHPTLSGRSSSNTSVHSVHGATNALSQQHPAGAADSHSDAASSNSAPVPRSNVRHSPPPSYDDLLPPAYDAEARRPPPYRPVGRR